MNRTPPLAHRIVRPSPYVPADAHYSTDHLRQVFRAARKANPSPAVVRVPPLVVDQIGRAGK
jgi:hypothetical protein